MRRNKVRYSPVDVSDGVTMLLAAHSMEKAADILERNIQGTALRMARCKPGTRAWKKYRKELGELYATQGRLSVEATKARMSFDHKKEGYLYGKGYEFDVMRQVRAVFNQAGLTIK